MTDKARDVANWVLRSFKTAAVGENEGWILKNGDSSYSYEFLTEKKLVDLLKSNILLWRDNGSLGTAPQEI